MYHKDYLDNHLYGTFTSLNAAENEKNLVNLSNKINFMSNYSSSFVNRKSECKIKLIK